MSEVSGSSPLIGSLQRLLKPSQASPEKTDLDTLNAELVGLAKETMQPAHVSFWLLVHTPDDEVTHRCDAPQTAYIGPGVRFGSPSYLATTDLA
jgi:hypothetical protein